MNYSEKLKDPRWQRKRLEVLQRDNFSCFWCGDTRTTLHVHHEMYFGPNPWDTPDECLTSLCADCHAINHLDLTELEKILLESIRMSNRGNLEYIKLTNRVVTRSISERTKP
jgi:5-methylcytosine-specific restriction endonuclease McrA